MSAWIEHDGRSVPKIDGLRCDIRFRPGTVFENENSYDWWSDWTWADRVQSADDIVAYRLPTEEPS